MSPLSTVGDMVAHRTQSQLNFGTPRSNDEKSRPLTGGSLNFLPGLSPYLHSLLLQFVQSIFYVRMSNDSVTLKHASRFPATNLHDHALCNPGISEIAGSRSTKIVEKEFRYSGCFASVVPGATEIRYSLPIRSSEDVVVGFFAFDAQPKQVMNRFSHFHLSAFFVLCRTGMKTDRPIREINLVDFELYQLAHAPSVGSPNLNDRLKPDFQT